MLGACCRNIWEQGEGAASGCMKQYCKQAWVGIYTAEHCIGLALTHPPCPAPSRVLCSIPYDILKVRLQHLWCACTG